MIPDTIREGIAAHLGEAVRSAAPLGGGCIAHASCVETAGGRYFLKWGDGDAGRTFEAEAAGLALLRPAAAGALFVPEVVAVQAPSAHAPGYLLLEWIEPGPPEPGFWDAFGCGLAGMHRAAGGRYGADRDNYIGRLPQHNAGAGDWPDFFRSRRLEPQVERARRVGVWNTDWDASLERLYARLPDILPGDPVPSVLHGDLWSGNFMVTSGGTAALIDPAAYHGHRETDLAMTELFGGFDARFYEAYDAAWPLEPGYPERRSLYNLYHLINHLNHFGGGYAGSVASTLARFA